MQSFRPPWAGAPCTLPPCPVPPADVAPVLLRAIEGEAAARQAYLKILRMAPTTEAETNIRIILEDELKHLETFSTLLARVAPACPPPLRAPEPALVDYEEGVREAYYDELDAAEFYRSVVLSTSDPRVRRSFFEAMTDEMEHAIRLNRLFFLTLRHGT